MYALSICKYILMDVFFIFMYVSIYLSLSMYVCMYVYIKVSISLCIYFLLVNQLFVVVVSS